MKEISALDFNENIFKLIGKDWFLVTADDENKTNMMTASWGGMGVLFNKNVVTIYVRPSRYTKTFIDKSEKFSLCVLPENYRDALAYCGKVSGRDEDKISKTGLTVSNISDCSVFNESKIAFVCKKLYSQQMDANLLVDKKLRDTFWKEDVHVMYIAEIEKILVNE
ncbi:MAG: flavin reductase family protein [Treponema sp.]|nr:flavin reductase family protein [Treponema sp.]